MHQEPPVPKKKTIAARVENVYRDTAETDKSAYQDWVELDQIYNGAAHLIVSTLAELRIFVQQPEIFNYMEHPEELRVLIKGTQQDMDSFANELLAIRERHKGRFGPIVSTSDTALALRLYGQYSELSERIMMLSQNTMLNIMDIGLAAEARMKKAQQETQQQEPAQNV